MEPNEPAFTARVSTSPEHEDGSTKLGEVVELIASLKETIAQQHSIIANQNDIIGSVRTDLGARVIAKWEQEGVHGTLGDRELDSPEWARAERLSASVLVSGASKRL